jgi:hypothetical protein
LVRLTFEPQVACLKADMFWKWWENLKAYHFKPLVIY